MAGVVYNTFKEMVMEGEIDLTSASIKLMLVTGHTPNIDTHIDYADVSGDEESGTGYTAGGEALTGNDVTMDTSNDLGKFDANSVTWTNLDVGTPSHAILYDDTNSVTHLICYWAISTASNGANYTVDFNASGILTIT